MLACVERRHEYKSENGPQVLWSVNAPTKVMCLVVEQGEKSLWVQKVKTYSKNIKIAAAH